MVESSIPKQQPGLVVKPSSVTRQPSPSTPKRSPGQQGNKRTIRLARSASDGLVSSERVGSPQRMTGRRLRLFSIWLIATLVLVGTGGIGTKWLVRYWPGNNCQTLVPMASDSERLYCIQLAAESGDLESLVAAMNLVGTWGEDHPLFAEGQHLLRSWSNTLFNLAQQQLSAGRLEEGVRLARQIPLKSPLYPEAQVAIANWQQEWQQGARATHEFEMALQKQDWRAAMQVFTDLSDFKLKYWHDQKANQLLLRLGKEKEATWMLQSARDLAEAKTPQSLTEAIALVKKIDATTYAKREAQLQQNQWSRTLLKIAAERLDSEDFAGAIATAKAVPQDNALYKEAQDWITLSRASEVAQQDDINALLAALETVRQIDPQSPLFPQAKTRAQLWQAKIQG
jgi:hypothetical protein